MVKDRQRHPDYVRDVKLSDQEEHDKLAAKMREDMNMVDLDLAVSRIADLADADENVTINAWELTRVVDALFQQKLGALDSGSRKRPPPPDAAIAEGKKLKVSVAPSFAVGEATRLLSDTLKHRDQKVSQRDFFPTALAALLMQNHTQAAGVLRKAAHLLHAGVFPNSFTVSGDTYMPSPSSIGRAAPVDSGFWWIILLRSYTLSTKDRTLAELPEVQQGIMLILRLCLADGFATSHTLACPDGCSMIDTTMGIHGYPIEIQSLFYFALRCAKLIIKPEICGKELLERIDKRIKDLGPYIQANYWMNFTELSKTYCYKTDEYSQTAANKFNVSPESILDWVLEFMPSRGGYLIGNVSPARMDLRWFFVGNCIAFLSCLATPAQATAIMDLIEERWNDLIGERPLKIT